MSDSVIYGANWYIDTLNCRKRLDEVQVPRLAKAKETFIAGGGFFRLAVPSEIEELEAPFGLFGSHEDVRSLFGREPGDWTTFYYYERLRDIINGRNRGRLVILKGLVNETEQPKVKGKRADMTRYTVGSIILYHDVVDGRTVHKFDFDNNQLVINGIDYSAEHNRLIAA